jgi:glyoxylase-like metal-dependent hydrolase (beta-lactamase superfamily II)
MVPYTCVTCGSQFSPSAAPPASCPVCLDERQFVGHEGQRWTTSEELARTHHNRVEEVEPGMIGIGIEPDFAIGQRALLVERLLWDCVSLLEEATAERIAARGGIDAIAISHPHFYTAMVEWAERLDARVLLHEDDREWIMRPSPRIELWSGERLSVSDVLPLVRVGGHFAGGTVCLWEAGAGGRGALLASDIVMVVPDRDWASFMWSYPNLIPLPPREIERIRAVVEELEFDRVYGGWWDRVMADGAREKVLRSAERYLRAVS